jgi:hypothetical protein
MHKTLKFVSQKDSALRLLYAKMNYIVCKHHYDNYRQLYPQESNVLHLDNTHPAHTHLAHTSQVAHALAEAKYDLDIAFELHNISKCHTSTRCT